MTDRIQAAAASGSTDPGAVAPIDHNSAAIGYPSPPPCSRSMHTWTHETEQLAQAVIAHVMNRLRQDPPPLNRTIASPAIARRAGRTITPHGLGGEKALRVFSEIIAPNSISTDHPAYLAYVPTAPTKASVLFDFVVSASSIIGSGWIDGGAGIWLENEALRWLADVVGLPAGAGGCFVSGGSAGNLSALAAARHTALERLGRQPSRWRLVASSEAHASIVSAAGILDVDIVRAPVDERGCLTGTAVDECLTRMGEDAFAVVATAGTTTAGVIDDLASIATVCRKRNVWFHVDGAYGAAALCVPSARERFRGIEFADSLIVDPHKWLFAPYDCCALLYAKPARVVPAFVQEASYLEESNALPEWNPMHYAFHLTRRVRGLPLWFSLAAHGTDAYSRAIEYVLSLTRRVASEIRCRPNLDLVIEPELSIVLFSRRGWTREQYEAWSKKNVEEQIAFVLPTEWRGDTVLRLCFVNPCTSFETAVEVLDSLE